MNAPHPRHEFSAKVIALRSYRRALERAITRLIIISAPEAIRQHFHSTERNALIDAHSRYFVLRRKVVSFCRGRSTASEAVMIDMYLELRDSTDLQTYAEILGFGQSIEERIIVYDRLEEELRQIQGLGLSLSGESRGTAVRSRGGLDDDAELALPDEILNLIRS